MSYILDALKKSEMQARQGELPTIHSTHGLGGARAERPGWHYALLGGIAAAALFSVTLMLQEKPQPDAPRPTMAAADPAATMPPSTHSQAMPASPAPAKAPTAAMPPAPAARPAMAGPATDIPAGNGATANSQPPRVATPQTARQQPSPANASAPITTPPPPVAEAGMASTPAPREDTPQAASRQAGTAGAIPMPDVHPTPSIPPLLGKLPVSVQQSLPKIDIAGHIYDDRPSVRMVFINGQIRREGDSIAPNLRLMAITPDGVQFSYRDTPFRIELFGNRQAGAK